MQTDSRHSQCICGEVGIDRWRLSWSNVPRGLVVLAMIAILTAILPSSGAAQDEVQLGQLCWRFNPPFTDTLRLAIAQLPLASADDALLFEVSVRWRATASAIAQTVGGPGPVTYQLLGAGTLATENVPTPTNVELGFEAVHNSAAFGGNLSCNFFASLNITTLNGPWRVQCSGTTTPFTNTGMLTFETAGCPDAQF